MIEPSEQPSRTIHQVVLDRLDGLKLAAAAAPTRGRVSFEAIGPRAGEAAALMDGTAGVVDALDRLHHHIWKLPLPRPGQDGFLNPDLVTAVLDAYALELSGAGLGRPLRLPLEFTPEQPAPALPGLAVSLRLVFTPEGGRGRVFVAFLIDPDGT